LAGVFLGLVVKRFKTALLGGVFFVFWGVVLPILFVFVFSIFGMFDPPLLDAVLYGILHEPLDAWNYNWLMQIFNNNLFIAWSIAGTLELAIIITVIALPFAGLMQLIKKD